MRFNLHSPTTHGCMCRPIITTLLRILLVLFAANSNVRFVARADNDSQEDRSKDTAAYANFTSFITGRQAVKNALVEFRFGRAAPPQLFAFSYQSNRFFGREYCTNEHHLAKFCLSDKMYGRYGDEFWYYNGDPASPLIYTYTFTPGDTNTMGYLGFIGQFNVFAGLFQSFGLSDQGLNTVSNTGDTLSINYHKKHPKNVAKLTFRGGLPYTASMLYHDDHGHAGSRRFVYFYDTNICPRGIPSACVEDGGGLQVKVLQLQLLIPPLALTKADCFPKDVFANTNIGLVIHSNKMDYFVLKDGRRVSMSGSIPDREMAQIRAGRRFFYVGAITLGVLVLLPLWSVHRRHKQQQQHKSKQ